MIAATSLSAFSSFRWTAARYSISCFSICRDRSDQHHGKFERITEGEVENDDNDEFGPEK